MSRSRDDVEAMIHEDFISSYARMVKDVFLDYEFIASHENESRHDIEDPNPTAIKF